MRRSPAVVLVTASVVAACATPRMGPRSRLTVGWEFQRVSRVLHFDGESLEVRTEKRAGVVDSGVWRTRLSDSECAVLSAAIESVRASSPPVHPVNLNNPLDYRLDVVVHAAENVSPAVRLRDVWDPRLGPLISTVDAMLPHELRIGLEGWMAEATSWLDDWERARILFPTGREPGAVVGRIVSRAGSATPLKLEIRGDYTWRLIAAVDDGPESVVRTGAIRRDGRVEGLAKNNRAAQAILRAEDVVVEGPIRVRVGEKELEHR